MEKILFENALIKIGSFQISPYDIDFDREGFVTEPLIVFPHRSIWIKHHNKSAFVADSTIINLYNQQQPYQRYAIDPKGDFCHWIELSPQLQSYLKQHKKPRLFNTSYFPCDVQIYLNYQHLLHQLYHQNKTDEMEIEEIALDIIHQIKQSLNLRENTTHINPSHKRLVQRIKQNIHEQLGRKYSLSELAQEVYSSPFHMSRVFKRITSIGINQYRTQVRLKKVYSAITNGHGDLADLALLYGFSSHSHLTSCFKNYFGLTPSTVKRAIF